VTDYTPTTDKSRLEALRDLARDSHRQRALGEPVVKPYETPWGVDGGYVQTYEVGDWHMELVFLPDGSVSAECDADVTYARNAALAWTAWADFVEREGWNG
jgi:hypothetical protein